jgi:hypothetical protein
VLEHAACLRQDDLGPTQAVFPLDGLVPRGRLGWWPKLGIGYYPVEVGIKPYDQDYFNNFKRNAQTDLGKALMQARFDFVERHYQGTLVDVGIGSGAFIELRQSRGRTTYGYDVNPVGIKWLKKRKANFNPYRASVPAMTLWDVLEHIPNYQELLTGVQKWLFLSLPIFTDVEHVLRSKHFKPEEHCWYFTRDGLVLAMKACGFELISESNFESILGREDIGTFSFQRMVR